VLLFLTSSAGYARYIHLVARGESRARGSPVSSWTCAGKQLLALGGSNTPCSNMHIHLFYSLQNLTFNVLSDIFKYLILPSLITPSQPEFQKPLLQPPTLYYSFTTTKTSNKSSRVQQETHTHGR
jgi:hypothetical protein